MLERRPRTTLGSFDFRPTSAKRELRVARHGVRLVEDNELHPGAEQPLRPRELLDLAPNDFDASVVGGVELSSNGRGGGGEENKHSIYIWESRWGRLQRRGERDIWRGSSAWGANGTSP